MTITALNRLIAKRTAAAITEALEQLANGWTDHEVLEVARDAWAVIDDLKDQRDAKAELAGLVCARCDKTITGTPVRDAEQVAWSRNAARAWCSTDCLSADAEDYWTSRWSA